MTTLTISDNGDTSISKFGCVYAHANGGTFGNDVDTIKIYVNTRYSYFSGILQRNNINVYRTGYNFLGWGYSTTVVDSDFGKNNELYLFEYLMDADTVHVYAIWEAAIPTVTFNANSGIFPTSGGTQSIYNSTELTGSTALSSIVETPTKPGYVFKGWSTASTGSVQYTQASMPTISSDTTLYAIYEPDTTKVLLEKGAVDIILGKLKR